MCGAVGGLDRFIQIRFNTLITLENIDEVEEILPTSLSDRLFIDFVYNRVSIHLPYNQMTLPSP